MNRPAFALALLLAATSADAQVIRRGERSGAPASVTRMVTRSYPLVCRGSTALRTWVRPVREGLLLFDRSAGPASAGLAPGQCAWRDRAVSPAEPAMVSHVVPEGADAEPPYLWPAVLQDPARYWLFMVYNDGKGALVATSSREERR
ncbi:MAG TPA: hypothetical protein VF613_06600 [Longimicrobium sp.]